MSDSTALAYAVSAVLAAFAVVAGVGAVCLVLEGAYRLTRWLHRGEL